MTHPMVPNCECLEFFFLCSIFSDIITMPPQGERVRSGVNQQIEKL